MQQDTQQLTHLELVAAAAGSADLRTNNQGTDFVVTEGVDIQLNRLLCTCGDPGSCGITA